MLHELKIKQCFLIHILEGRKNFEVRFNDRDYQVGDFIRFLPLEDKIYDVYAVSKPILDYEITYVHHILGMEQGYVVLGLKVIGEA